MIEPAESTAALTVKYPGRDAARNKRNRSRTGCPECRKRKIKCDEDRPICRQCRRGGRTCRLIDSVFRHHQTSFSSATMVTTAVQQNVPAGEAEETSSSAWTVERQQPPESRAGGSPQRPWEAYHERVLGLEAQPGQPSTQQEFPSTEHQGDTQTNSQDEEAIPVVGNDHSSCSSALSWDQGAAKDYPATEPLARQAPGEHTGVDITPDLDLTPGQGDCPHEKSHDPNQPHVERSINDAAFAWPIEPSLGPLVVTISEMGEDGEIAFFLRHFFEGPGLWMDLFGSERYFSHQVLLLAKSSNLVSHSACAVAAKRLGQMQNPTANVLPSSNQHNITNRLISSGRDFLWYGAKYYEKAILQLARHLSRTDHASYRLSPSYFLPSGNSLDWSDETSGAQIVAACLLCQYESLSATMTAWGGHLDGLHKILSLIDNESAFGPNSPLQTFQSVTPPQHVVQWRTSFWYYLLSDTLESFIAKKKTRIDAYNLPLWRNMGLVLDNHGHLTTTSADRSQNKTLLSALIRILNAVVNYEISTSDDELTVVQTPRVNPVREAENQVANWQKLDRDLDRWLFSVPASFQPEIVLRTQSQEENGISDLFSDEFWFSDDVCAAATMFYHMARLVLLTRRPCRLVLEESVASHGHHDLLLAYQALHKQLQSHAKQVFSIAMGVSNDTVRSLMLQPLYVAGRCLAEKSDRRLLIQTLRALNYDLGIATEYRIRDLLNEWNATYNSLGILWQEEE